MVKLKSITPQAELNIVEIARVSSTRKNRKDNPEGLINYLIKNKHFSPFEHSYMTVDITTSKAIGIQLVRHRSFTFQEFSQRYSKAENFEPIELRRQAENNRQSSVEVIDPLINDVGGDLVKASSLIDAYLGISRELYRELLSAGVARECARMILPMCTQTKIYMTGSVRSWIHFIEIRDDEHAQKEIQELAKEIKAIFCEELPLISKALGWLE